MKALRVFFVFVASLVLWACCSAFLGYVFLEIAPCSWFGSSFEGACGYRAVTITFLIGCAITIAMSIYTTIRYATNKEHIDEVSSQTQR